MKKFDSYQIGDRVFYYRCGWGVIKAIYPEDSYPIKVDFLDCQCTFTLDGKYGDNDPVSSLSYEEYDFVNGGFSQLRPRPILKDGDLIYVKRVATNEWIMRYFHHWCDNGVVTYLEQDKSIEGVKWEEYSLTNPLEGVKNE